MDTSGYYESEKRNQILRRMSEYGANIAPVPFSSYIENRNGEEIWCVDLHIKVKRLTEFEINVEGKTLSEALKRAYIGISHEPLNLRAAARSNETFGVTV